MAARVSLSSVAGTLSNQTNNKHPVTRGGHVIDGYVLRMRHVTQHGEDDEASQDTGGRVDDGHDDGISVRTRS